MLALMLTPITSGWGWSINLLARRKPNKLQVNMIIKHCFFLVYAYNYLNPNDVNAQAPHFIPQNNHKFI